MEKYRQFADRASGIAPFLPNTVPDSTLATILHSFLFLFRLPFFLFFFAFYFTVSSVIPLPVVLRKLGLWSLMGIPGIWWVDLRIDGVRRGSLSQQPPDRVPHPRSVIAANFTSPLDALYLAAIFDPVFTQSFPGTRRVRRISLLRAFALALSPPPAPTAGGPPADAKLTDLGALLARYPGRVVAVFPECTTTNGRGILPLSPSLLGVPAGVRVFAVNLRYDPTDVTTPVPGAWAGFLWRLLSRPTHCIRVRISEPIMNTAASTSASTARDQNGQGNGKVGETLYPGMETLTQEETRVLDRVGEALARLGRIKRVGLTLKDKAAFVEAWNRR